MEGYKLIKTTFENNKEIVGVHFNGDESYYTFLNEVKHVYNIPNTTEIQVYSTDFIIKPKIFVHFVAQYINNLDFVLDIKVTSNFKTQTTAGFSSSLQIPSTSLSPSHQIPLPISSSSHQLHLTALSPSSQIPLAVLSSLQQIPSTEEIKEMCEIQECVRLKALENKHRTKIAKAIISAILTYNPDKKLLREEFFQLSQSIVEIFPFEVKETYYVPFTKGCLAKGKLYDAYNNKRARLSSSGVIQRRSKLKSQPTVALDDSNILSDGDVDENQLEILKSGCVDWDLVLEIWTKTHFLRRNEFKNDNFEPIDYMQKYKVLQHEKNYELFEIDFNIMYPTSKSIYEWKTYYLKIIDMAEKIKDSNVKDILTYIEYSWEEDTKLALSFLLVPYLMPTSRHRTKLEVQESFISYCKNFIKDEDDYESNHSMKRLKLDNMPRIYFIGDCIRTVSFAYMDFYGRRHIFQNPLQAIEVCFRCFLGSYTKYPKSCEHVWLFLQKLIFQINTPEDAVIPCTNTLINDLQQHVPESLSIFG